jgi:hypothetical protein
MQESFAREDLAHLRATSSQGQLKRPPRFQSEAA